MINYFEYYNLTESFNVDQRLLRKLYYENSRKFHPDLYTLESTISQEKVLEQSTVNNEAYKTLKDEDLRLRHLLTIKGVMSDQDKEQISQAFLMEMMDVNEAIMDAQMGDISEDRINAVKKDINELMEELNSNIIKAGESTLDESNLTHLKDLYYRKKYLKRLIENVNKI